MFLRIWKWFLISSTIFFSEGPNWRDSIHFEQPQSQKYPIIIFWFLMIFTISTLSKMSKNANTKSKIRTGNQKLKFIAITLPPAHLTKTHHGRQRLDQQPVSLQRVMKNQLDPIFRVTWSRYIYRAHPIEHSLCVLSPLCVFPYRLVVSLSIKHTYSAHGLRVPFCAYAT